MSATEKTMTSAAPGMAEAATRRMTWLLRALAVVCALGFFLPFSYLLIGLRFTDQSAQTSFALFQQHGAIILFAYYALGLDGLLVILFTLLVTRRLARDLGTALWIATVGGVLGGLAQAIGDLRWPFALAVLANAYNAPHASDATRTSAVLIFDAVDQLLGVMLSEHLFYLLIGAWSFALGWYLLRARSGAGQAARWLAWLGLASGVLYWVSSVEQFDIAALSSILLLVVVIGRVVWGVWVISLAWSLTGARRP